MQRIQVLVRLKGIPSKSSHLSEEAEFDFAFEAFPVSLGAWNLPGLAWPEVLPLSAYLLSGIWPRCHIASQLTTIITDAAKKQLGLEYEGWNPPQTSLIWATSAVTCGGGFHNNRRRRRAGGTLSLSVLRGETVSVYRLGQLGRRPRFPLTRENTPRNATSFLRKLRDWVQDEDTEENLLSHFLTFGILLRQVHLWDGRLEDSTANLWHSCLTHFANMSIFKLSVHIFKESS